MHTPGIKYVYMQIFMFDGFVVIEILLFNQEKKQKKMKNMGHHCEIEITSIIQAFLDLFGNIISFQHVLHFGVG